MARDGTRKLFAGARVRSLRQQHGLTQAAFAARLGVSTSYLNQIENNQRPISASVILALADTFNMDIASLAADESDRVLADLTELFKDPLFAEAGVSSQDIKIAAANTPSFTQALQTLYQAYRQASERVAGFDDVLAQNESALTPLPYEEVRDFFHYRDNYIDPLDRAAEAFSNRLDGERERIDSMIALLAERHGIRAVFGGEAERNDILRVFNQKDRILSLNRATGPATQIFQIAHQIAFLEQNDLIDQIVQDAGFKTADARDVCKMSLANYYAAAVIMPYADMRQAATTLRHDVEKLADRFGASLEQVAHRLSTLQRPGDKGVPFFFVRVDQAGNITKRHSATKLQFARFGGGCPLWNVHRAFETPDRIIRQLAETPDGIRYLCLARNVTKHGGGFRQPARRYAIALGCEVNYADQLVYADDLDIRNDQAFEPIGISCRICERENCHQRALPPIEKRLHIDHTRRQIVPYSLLDGRRVRPRH